MYEPNGWVFKFFFSFLFHNKQKSKRIKYVLGKCTEFMSRQLKKKRRKKQNTITFLAYVQVQRRKKFCKRKCFKNYKKKKRC